MLLHQSLLAISRLNGNCPRLLSCPLLHHRLILLGCYLILSVSRLRRRLVSNSLLLLLHLRLSLRRLRFQLLGRRFRQSLTPPASPQSLVSNSPDPVPSPLFSSSSASVSAAAAFHRDCGAAPASAGMSSCDVLYFGWRLVLHLRRRLRPCAAGRGTGMWRVRRSVCLACCSWLSRH